MTKRACSSDDPKLCLRIGENVREVRRIRHLTQAELARRIGISTGPLNSIERGKHVPSGRVLYRLAGALQVSVDTIMGSAFGGIVSSVPSPSTLVSKAADSGDVIGSIPSADAGDWPAARSVVLPDDPAMDDVSRLRINQVCRAFLALEDLCEAQKCAHMPLYYPFIVTEEGIDLLTAKVRQFLGVGQAVVFDYLELLENAGLRIAFCPLGEGLESAAFYDPVNANAFLIVQTGMNVERQLFELSKRLGSIYLHTQRIQLARRAPSAGVLSDLHAVRKFAALFLMPAAVVRASVEQLAIQPKAWTYELVLRLKHRFGVSAQSFLMRLNELDLITAAAHNAIEERIKAHYSRSGYGEPDSSRRILSPNGRLGDLLVTALADPRRNGEAREIEQALRKAGVNWRDCGRNRKKAAGHDHG